MDRGVLVARSRDYERLSVQSGNNYGRKFSKEIDECQFDGNNRYIPSKEFIKNKKSFVIAEEKLENRNRDFINAKKRTRHLVNDLMKSIEREIFKKKA